MCVFVGRAGMQRRGQAPSRLTDELCAYIHEICACSSHGGRVCGAVGDELDRHRGGAEAAAASAVVMDVSDWTDEMTTCVKARFPGADVSVHSSSGSLAGFSVLVSVPGSGGGGRAWAWGGPLSVGSLVGGAFRLAAMAASMGFLAELWWRAMAGEPPPWAKQ